MKIVVTGAAGFIGSVLSVRATELHHQVLGLDDLSRGQNEPWHKVKGDGFRFLVHDCSGGIGEPVGAVGAWLAAGVDAVVHLAAATGSLDRPYDELRRLNVEMPQRVFEDAVSLGAKAFVYPVTSLVLGVPDSPYVRSKEEGLEGLKANDRDGLPSILLPVRLFNVAGAYKGLSEFRKKEVHLVPRLVDCWLGAGPLLINGGDYGTIDGTPSRDFVNVLDVVETVLELVGRMVQNRRVSWVTGDDGAFWMGTRHATTVLQAKAIAEQYLGPIKHEIGLRRAYDCGGLWCPEELALAFRDFRQPTPAWVSIRDEVLALFDGHLAGKGQ